MSNYWQCNASVFSDHLRLLESLLHFCEAFVRIVQQQVTLSMILESNSDGFYTPQCGSGAIWCDGIIWNLIVVYAALESAVRFQNARCGLLKSPVCVPGSFFEMLVVVLGSS